MLLEPFAVHGERRCGAELEAFRFRDSGADETRGLRVLEACGECGGVEAEATRDRNARRIITRLRGQISNVSAGGFVPFSGRIRMVEAVAPEGLITNAANAARYVFPYSVPGTGVTGNEAQVRWGEAVKGNALVNLRMDVPA